MTVLSLSSNKQRFLRVNYLINAAFEDMAFIRARRLFHFSLPNATFIGWRRLKEEIRYSGEPVPECIRSK